MDQTKDLEEVATRFLTAWADGDMTSVAALLHPEVRFRSPANDLTGRDEVLAVIGAFAQVVTGITVRAVTSSPPDVMVMYDIHTAPFGTLLAVDHFVIEAGRIVGDTLVFDTAPMQSAAR